MAAHINAGTFKATIFTIQGVSTITESRAALEALKAAGDSLHSQIRDIMSKTDHTLADLAALDHPYARRHGSIQIHQSEHRIIAVPTSVVHKQSGQLLRALRGGIIGRAYRVELLTSSAPHAKFITQGTRVMLARDPLGDVARDPRMKAKMMKAIVTRLGKELRSKTAVRFDLGVR